MSDFPLLLYVITLLFWIGCIHGEGGIGLGIRFLFLLSTFDFFLAGPFLYFLADITPKGVGENYRNAALSLTLYGFLSFLVAGYYIVPSLMGSRLSMPTAWTALATKERLAVQRKAGYHLLKVGLVSLLLNPIALRIPTVRAIWSTINCLIETGMVMLFINAILANDRRRLVNLFMLQVGIGAVRAVFSGHFGFVVLQSQLLLCLALLSSRPRPSAWLILGVAGCIAFIPVTIWLSGREKMREAMGKGAGISERITAFLEGATMPDSINPIDEANLNRVQERLDYSNLFAAALQHTPENEPYAMGSTIFEPAMMALIPRIIWPSKPISAGGSAYVTRFTGIDFQNASIATSYFFEFYVNYGPVAVIIGMGILGLVCGLGDYYYFKHAEKHIATEWTIFLCFWCLTIIDTMGQLAMSLPVALFVSYILKKTLPASIREAAPVG
jgi:hypothetical protein